MKKFITFRKAALLLLAVSALSSCHKDDPGHGQFDERMEYKYVRVVVSDEVSNKITQIAPVDGSTTTFDAQHPMATLYSTASNRYAALVYGTQNFAQFFDTGLEWHDGHVDTKGTPKWAAITAQGARPSYFKSRGAESLIFNDQDGTISHANEANFHTQGATFSAINAGLPAHHGVLAQFDNGNIAVSTANTAGGRPNRIKIINKSGAEIHASTIEVARLHGHDTDGNNAVFGSFIDPTETIGGVLVVNQSGQQRVIANPEGFGPTRLGSILYAKGANKFIGFGGSKGAYLIDLTANRITPIYEGNDAYQCKTDKAGKNLFVLTLDGRLRIYDLVTMNLKKEGMVTEAVVASEAMKPVLEATEKFAYLAMPAAGEVHQVRLTDFNDKVKHSVTARPVRLTILGFESNESH
jgi:hypothetical protein